VPSPYDSFGELPWIIIVPVVAQNRVVYFASVIDPLDIHFVQYNNMYATHCSPVIDGFLVVPMSQVHRGKTVRQSDLGGPGS
jgi:hypothetical protein